MKTTNSFQVASLLSASSTLAQIFKKHENKKFSIIGLIMHTTFNNNQVKQNNSQRIFKQMEEILYHRQKILDEQEFHRKFHNVRLGKYLLDMRGN